MEIMINKKSKLIVSIIFLIVIITISIKSFAANIYTSKLSKGDILQFTGNAWTVYSTKDNAKSLKKDSNNKTLKKDDKFTILEIDGNVLKIKEKAYIYYGSTAKDYFKKIEKNSAKNENDNSSNTIGIAVTPSPSPNQITKSANQEKIEKQKKIVALARKQVGKKYVMNASGPNSFDCSGLTLYVYKKILGISLPHSANAQAKYGKKVKFSIKGRKINCSNMQLGDLIVFKGHVGIYSGNGRMIDAAGKSKGVVERSFNNSYWITKQPIKEVRRFV